MKAAIKYPWQVQTASSDVPSAFRCYFLRYLSIIFEGSAKCQQLNIITFGTCVSIRGKGRCFSDSPRRHSRSARGKQWKTPGPLFAYRSQFNEKLNSGLALLANFAQFHGICFGFKYSQDIGFASGGNRYGDHSQG